MIIWLTQPCLWKEFSMVNTWRQWNNFTDLSRLLERKRTIWSSLVSAAKKDWPLTWMAAPLSFAWRKNNEKSSRPATIHGLPGLFSGPPGHYGNALTVLYQRRMYCPALYSAAVPSAEEFMGFCQIWKELDAIVSSENALFWQQSPITVCVKHD